MIGPNRILFAPGDHVRRVEKGRMCIHPDQVPIANAACSPGEEVMARARRLPRLHDAIGQRRAARSDRAGERTTPR